MEKPDLSLHPLNEKLFIFRDIEGEINTEALDIFRELDKRFKDYDWYLGISMTGSNVRNYNLKSSDIDFRLIYDESKGLNRDIIIDIVKSVCKEIETHKGLESRHVSIPFLVSINIEKMKVVLQGDYNLEKTYFNKSLLIIKDLSGVLLGEKIESIRAYVKNILSSLPEDKRIKILEKVVHYCIMEESLDEEKFLKRTKMKPEDFISLKKSREELWKRRLDNLWCK